MTRISPCFAASASGTTSYSLPVSNDAGKPALSTHTAKAVGSFGFLVILVKQRQLQFQLSPANAVSFVPMDLRFMNCIIWKPHCGKSRQLSASTLAVKLVQASPITDATTDSDCLDVLDLADDFEVHAVRILFPRFCGHFNLTTTCWATVRRERVRCS